jgi:hypothetical protein
MFYKGYHYDQSISKRKAVIQTEPLVHYYEMTRTFASASGSTEKYILVHRVRKLSALGYIMQVSLAYYLLYLFF